MDKIALSKKLFDRAKKYIPGGVNSPARSFKAVGGYPVFIKKGRGSKIYGECGGEFIDYCLSWGALILGHAHPEVVEAAVKAIKKGSSFGTATKLETEFAKTITEAVPSIEQLRLTSSGTEAVMGAVKLAFAYTGRKRILKFGGSYHGWQDYPEIIAPYNDLARTEKLIEENNFDIAAIIAEPVAANSGVILPEDGFLRGLRDIADKHGIILIFDEVITGFRLGFGGAQGLFKVKPDLTTLGKIIGAGFPIGAFGGKREIMRLLAPEGEVYQAGTLSGNPVAVTAGLAALKILKEDKPYEALEKNTSWLCRQIEESAEEFDIAIRINRIGSIYSIFFSGQRVFDYESAQKQDTAFFKKFFHGLLKRGVYFSPSPFEANFISTAHKAQDFTKTLGAVKETFAEIKRKERL